MTSPDIHALTGAYALDAVSGMERVDFERHLAECESCAQEVRELRDTAAQLALAAAEPAPPALKLQVFNEIQTVRQLPPETTVVPLRRRSFTQRLTAVAAAVFFVAAAGLGVIVVRQNSQLDDANAQAAQLEQILSSPDAKLVTFEPTEDAPEGSGTMKMAVSQSQDMMLLLSGDLANAPAGRTYQLWGIEGERNPKSMGFVTPVNGQVALPVSGIGKADKVAISVEPENGSKQPTPDAIVMTGSLTA